MRPAARVRAMHLLQARLVDRHAAVVEDLDLARIDVEAEHVVADFGETRAGHETDVARADNGDFHTLSGGSVRCRLMPDDHDRSKPFACVGRRRHARLPASAGDRLDATRRVGFPAAAARTLPIEKTCAETAILARVARQVLGALPDSARISSSSLRRGSSAVASCASSRRVMPARFGDVCICWRASAWAASSPRSAATCLNATSSRSLDG